MKLSDYKESISYEETVKLVLAYRERFPQFAAFGRLMAKAKNKSLRSQLSQCTAKICAYMEVGKLDEARQWASILQQKLIELNLLVDNAARPGHNGQQPENVTTKPGPKLK